MAAPTGGQTDVLARLFRFLPAGWFPTDAKLLGSLLTGFSEALSATFSQITYTRAQTRLATVSDGFLNLAAADYFGAAFIRRTDETDAQFRTRVLPIFREAVTRQALIDRLTALTGNVPTVFEPSLPSDTGGYGVARAYGGYATVEAVVEASDGVVLTTETNQIVLAGGVPQLVGAGAYGSLAYPFQIFVTVARPSGAGIPGVTGYGSGYGGWGVGAIEYASLDMETAHITDADIYAAIVAVLPAGVTAWVQLSGAPISGVAPLGVFRLGVNVLGSF